MTPPPAVRAAERDASVAVGYTYPPRSLIRRATATAPRRPPIACGARHAAASSSNSTRPADVADVLARVETVRRGDSVITPRGMRFRVEAVEEVTFSDGSRDYIIRHERGSFAPLRRGERLPVERSAVRSAGTAGGERAAPESMAGAGPASPASPTIPHKSPTRVRVLASTLCGYRWPGDMPRPGSRRHTAAEQVARNALEHMAVVE
jgi:hypothetical protein